MKNEKDLNKEWKSFLFENCISESFRVTTNTSVSSNLYQNIQTSALLMHYFLNYDYLQNDSNQSWQK